MEMEHNQIILSEGVDPFTTLRTAQVRPRCLLSGLSRQVNLWGYLPFLQAAALPLRKAASP